MTIFSLLGYYIIQCHDICASVNKRPGGYLCFSINPSPHTSFPHPAHASCQVSSNSIDQFPRRSRKCLSQPKAGGGHIVLPISPKNTNLVEDVESFLASLSFVKFHSAVSEDTFLCSLLRYWLEIWYMNWPWHNKDQSRLTDFYRSYCPL